LVKVENILRERSNWHYQEDPRTSEKLLKKQVLTSGGEGNGVDACIALSRADL
jgi:hypothetical protein